MSKKIAFLDVDNFLLDFNKEAVKYINSILSEAGAKLPLDYRPKTWGFEETGAPGDWFKHMPTSWVLDIEPYPEAVDFTHHLHDWAGARVVLVTKVPVDRAVDRMRNMARHGFYWDEMIAVPETHKKSDYVNATLERFPMVEWVFADDYAKQCLDIIQNCPKAADVVVLDVSYNDPFEKVGMNVLATPQMAYQTILDTLSGSR